MKTLLGLVSIFATVILVSCSFGPDSPKGFSLPKGDEIAGEKVFMQYQCLACHTLQGYENPDIIKEFDIPIPLGGTSTMVTTYGQLVTSVINPSHRLAPRSHSIDEKIVDAEGKSKMRVFNEVMTIQELIDLVAFLQPKYKVKPITYTHYGQYRTF